MTKASIQMEIRYQIDKFETVYVYVYEREYTVDYTLKDDNGDTVFLDDAGNRVNAIGGKYILK